MRGISRLAQNRLASQEGLCLKNYASRWSLYRPLGLQEFETPRISWHSAHGGGKVAELRTGNLCPPEDIPGSVSGWAEPRVIVRPKEASEHLANRARDLLASSAVSQPTAPLRSPHAVASACQRSFSLHKWQCGTAPAVSSRNKGRGVRRKRLVAGLSPCRVGCQWRPVIIGYWRTE
jgi:hypothetical protein